MKKNLRYFMTLLLMMVASVGWADYDVVYTFTHVKNSSNTDYTQVYDVEIDGITWSVPGNQSNADGLRIGGKSITDVDRIITGKNSISKVIDKITVNHSGTTSDNIKVNSVKVIVASDENFENSIDEVTVTPTISKNESGSFDFTPNTGKTWSEESYYKIVFNLTNSKSSNYAFVVNSIVFYQEVSKTATTTSIDDTGITNTAIDMGTEGGSLSAIVMAGENQVLGATVTWESSNTGVATIANDGTLTLVKEGTTTITANYAGDATYSPSSASYELTVTDSRVENGLAFAESDQTVIIGQTLSAPTLTNPHSLPVTYSSSDKNVATVDKEGNVTGVAVGTATITAAFAGNESYKIGSATYTITVIKALPEGALFYESVSGYTSTTDYNNSPTADHLDSDQWESFTKVYSGKVISGDENGHLKFGSSNAAGEAVTKAISLTGTGTLTFKVQQYDSKNAGNLKISATGATVTGDIDVTGTAEWVEKTVSLTKATGKVVITFATTSDDPRIRVDDILVVEGGKMTASVTISSTKININETATVSTDENAPTVKLSTSDAAIASVDGTTVKGVAAGTATITAKWEEDDNYNGGEKEFTITVVDPNGPGTENNPYTVAQALEIINGLEDGGITSDAYFVKGFVVGTPNFERKDDDGSLYGNCNFDIADAKGGTTTLTIFRGKSFGNNSFTEDDVAAPILEEGDEVVLTGKLQKYVKNEVMTPELTNGYLVSVNVSVTITSCGYATLISNHALDFSKANGATAYIVKDNDISDNAITLTPVTKVPAKTGLVIAGTAGETYSIPTTSDETEDVDGNLMVGNADNDITIVANQGYILAASDGLFHPCSGGTLAKGKAYLNVAVPTPGEAKNLTIVFGEGTGINNVNVNENESGKIFNLAGQQMKSAVKGVYIKNGKKYIK